MSAASSSAVSIGAVAPGRDDRLGDPPRGRLLAVLAEQRGELVGRQRREQLRRRHAAAGVEAHVQRAAGAEPEAAVAVGELERRQPEVEQHPVDRRRSPRPARPRPAPGSSPAQDQPVAEPREPVARPGRSPPGPRPGPARGRRGWRPPGSARCAHRRRPWRRSAGCRGAGTGSRGPRPASPASALPPSLLHRSVADPERTLEAHVVRRQIPSPAIASANASGPRGSGCSRPSGRATRSRRGPGRRGRVPRRPGRRRSAGWPGRGRDPGGRAPSRRPRRTAAAGAAARSVGHGQAADLRRQLVPCRHREDREAGVEPPRDDARPGELRAEARQGRRAAPSRRPHAGTRR